MYRFWKAVADDYDDYEGSLPDYTWLAKRLHNAWLDETVGPILGPPMPPGIMDIMLRNIYAPALLAQINQTNTLFAALRK